MSKVHTIRTIEGLMKNTTDLSRDEKEVGIVLHEPLTSYHNSCKFLLATERKAS